MSEMIRDIFKHDDVEVQPPERIETLFAEIKTAVERYIKSGSACRGDCETYGLSTNDVSRWGGCPECHQNDGYRFYESDIYFVCATHRFAWKVGNNLFSAWQHMTHEAILAQKLELEFGYTPTESPWHPPKMYTMADGSEKLVTDLKPGDIVVESGGRPHEVEDVFEDGSITYRKHDVPNPCPTCGCAEVDDGDIPF